MPQGFLAAPTTTVAAPTTAAPAAVVGVGAAATLHPPVASTSIFKKIGNLATFSLFSFAPSKRNATRYPVDNDTTLPTEDENLKKLLKALASGENVTKFDHDKIQEKLEELFKKLNSDKDIKPSEAEQFGESVAKFVVETLRLEQDTESSKIVKNIAKNLAYSCTTIADVALITTVVSQLFKKGVISTLKEIATSDNLSSLMIALIFSSSFDDKEQGMLSVMKSPFIGMFRAMQGLTKGLKPFIDSMMGNFEELDKYFDAIEQQREELKSKLATVKNQISSGDPEALEGYLELITKGLELAEKNKQPTSNQTHIEKFLASAINILFSIPFKDSYDTKTDFAIRNFFKSLASFCEEKDATLKCSLEGLVDLFSNDEISPEQRLEKLQNLTKNIEKSFEDSADQQEAEYSLKSLVNIAVAFGGLILLKKNIQSLDPEKLKWKHPEEFKLHPQFLRELLSESINTTKIINPKTLTGTLQIAANAALKFTRTSVWCGKGATHRDSCEALCKGFFRERVAKSASIALATTLLATLISCSESVLEQFFGLDKSKMTPFHAHLASGALLKYALGIFFVGRADEFYNKIIQSKFVLEAFNASNEGQFFKNILDITDETLISEKPVCGTEDWKNVKEERKNGQRPIVIDELLKIITENNNDSIAKKYLLLKKLQLCPKEIQDAEKQILEQITLKDVLNMGSKGLECIGSLTLNGKSEYKNLLTIQKENYHETLVKLSGVTAQVVERYILSGIFTDPKPKLSREEIGDLRKAIIFLDKKVIDNLSDRTLSLKLTDNEGNVVTVVDYLIDKLRNNTPTPYFNPQFNPQLNAQLIERLTQKKQSLQSTSDHAYQQLGDAPPASTTQGGEAQSLLGDYLRPQERNPRQLQGGRGFVGAIIGATRRRSYTIAK